MTLDVDTTNPMTTLVPPPSLDQTAAPSIAPKSSTQSSPSICECIIIYLSDLYCVFFDGGVATPMDPEENGCYTSSIPGINPG